MLCAVLTAEQDVNVCAAAVDVLAEVGTPRRVPRSSSARLGLVRMYFLASQSRSLSTELPPNPHPLVTEYPALTEEEFRRLCEYLYRRTGMIFTESKRLLRGATCV